RLSISLLILLFGFTLNSFAQEASVEQTRLNDPRSVGVGQAYTDFYKYPREKIIAQLNKTVFLAGESIWFQAYLIEPKTGKTSNISSNIYAGIFDENGKLIKHKLLFAEDGVAGGSFPIDSTFTGREFTLKMFTRYMLNFDENPGFNQRVFVIHDDLYPNPKLSNLTPPLKIDYYTEGDSGLVENFINGLVYTLTDKSGERVEISSGELVDASGKSILSLDENKSGIGKSAFFVKPDAQYSMRLTAYNGTVVEAPLETKKQGVLMTINNTNDAKLTVGLLNNFSENTSKESLSYDLVIEKDGYIFTKKVQLEPSKEYVLNLQKDVFTTGVYKTYLLQDDKIILERSFFNQTENFSAKPTVSVISAKKDSLVLQLSTSEKESFVFSASLLPENTGSLLYRTSLSNQLFDENINKNDRAALAELDMNLIAKDKSGDEWKDLLGTTKPLDYDFEKGISFRGKIKLKNDKPLKDKIIVFNESMSFQQTLEPDKDGSFESRHNYLENGTILKVALIDDKKKLKKPELDFFEVFPDVVEVLTDYPAQKIDEQAQTILNNYNSEASGFPLIEQGKKVTALKEVEVSAVKKEKVLEHKPIMFSEVDTKGYKVTNDEIRQFQYVTDFIRTKGYNVSLSTVVVRDDPSSPPITSKRGGSKGPEAPTIYLDEMILTDVTVLFRMNMNIVDEIYIDYSALSSGIRAGNGGQGGIIYIITKKGSIGSYSDDYNPENQVEVTVKNGFNPSENYQSPNYTDLDSPIFQKYGTLDWKASLSTDTDGKSTFVLNNKGLKKVKLLIEGLSNQGKVISWVEEIEVSN
ncbi:MAG: hypothetical protein Q8J97_14895, partial [Flavobacteriaceae bacterium]|nr:hypothetical protein [Flavobacteriaceae bacterium]